MQLIAPFNKSSSLVNGIKNNNIDGNVKKEDGRINKKKKQAKNKK